MLFQKGWTSNSSIDFVCCVFGCVTSPKDFITMEISTLKTKKARFFVGISPTFLGKSNGKVPHRSKDPLYTLHPGKSSRLD